MNERLIAQCLAANLAKARQRIGISQEEVGFRAGLHPTAVGYLERGVRISRVDTVVKLAAALGVPVADLFAGITWELPHFSAGTFKVQLQPESESGSRR
jgi:transcriptional regulator with XRE-family HTH domain